MTTTGSLTTPPSGPRPVGEAPAAADELRVGNDGIRFRVTSAQTDGAVVAAEVRMPAGGGPPMLHRHAPAEVYRVERGELAIYLESGDGTIARVVASRGSVVPIPGGRAHTIRNESGEEALAYVVFAPGAPMERFVRAAAALPTPPRVEDVLALAERHGIEMTGPIPGAGFKAW